MVKQWVRESRGLSSDTRLDQPVPAVIGCGHGENKTTPPSGHLQPSWERKQNREKLNKMMKPDCKRIKWMEGQVTTPWTARGEATSKLQAEGEFTS